MLHPSLPKLSQPQQLIKQPYKRNKNFDDLNLTFIPNPLSLTDSSAKINKLIIPRAIIKSGFDYIILSNFFTQFSISNLAIKTSQQFLPQEINSCFSLFLE